MRAPASGQLWVQLDRVPGCEWWVATGPDRGLVVFTGPGTVVTVVDVAASDCELVVDAVVGDRLLRSFMRAAEQWCHAFGPVGG